MRERERGNVSGEGAEREREREKDTESEAGSRIGGVSAGPHMGPELPNLEIMT